MGRQRNEPAASEAGKKPVWAERWSPALWVWAGAFCLPRCLPHSSALNLTWWTWQRWMKCSRHSTEYQLLCCRACCEWEWGPAWQGSGLCPPLLPTPSSLPKGSSGEGEASASIGVSLLACLYHHSGSPKLIWPWETFLLIPNDISHDIVWGHGLEEAIYF